MYVLLEVLKKKTVHKKCRKKSTDHDQTLNQEPTYLTSASLTTEPLLSWLITSLNLYLINEHSSLINKTDLSIENLDCSRTFYVCSIR